VNILRKYYKYSSVVTYQAEFIGKETDKTVEVTGKWKGETYFGYYTIVSEVK